MTSFELVPLSSITNRKYQNQWLIEDHMELYSMGMLFGTPGSAKSFIAMDIAFCVAAGIDWNGNKTDQGKVIYLAGEGFNGIQKRFCALEMKYKTSTNDIYFSDEPASLLDLDHLKIVFEKINSICPNPRLIIIDTLHRNFGEGDENSAKDVAKMLHHITALMKTLNCAIIFVHHSGHSSSNRARGSSSIKAALDVEYQISKKDAAVTMKCTKAKEFEEPPPSSFDLTPIPIPTLLDVDGNPIESAILQSTSYKKPTSKITLTSTDQIVLNSLSDLITAKGVPAPQSVTDNHAGMVGRNCIRKDAWRSDVYALLSKVPGGNNKQQASQKAFLRSSEKLLKHNKVAGESEYFWIPV